MGKIMTSILVIFLIIGTIFLSGCTGDPQYTLGNSTFNVPGEFQKGNVTSIDDPDYGYLSELTFKLNGKEVLGVDIYPNSAEYQRAIQDPILSDFKVYTKKINGTQVTVLEDPTDHFKNYFFTKNGKYYSVVTSFYVSTDPNLVGKLDGAMYMIVETMK